MTPIRTSAGWRAYGPARQDMFTGQDLTLTQKTAAMWQDAFADHTVAPKLPMSAEVWAVVAETARRKKAAGEERGAAAR